jgi:hypothetical protein
MTNRSTQPAGQTTTIQQSDPWAGVRPFLERQYSEANRLYNTGGPQYTPYSQVTPFTAGQEGALQGIENRAAQGSPLQAAGNQQMLNTVQGNYLSPDSNPYLGQTFDAAARRVKENVGNAFGGHGFGGTQHQEMLTRNLADMGANMYSQNYQTERGRQYGAMQGAPQYAQQDYNDLARALGAGGVRQDLGRRQLGDEVNRFNYAQNQPYANLAQFQAATSGAGQYGQQTSTAPFYQNQLGGMLSGAMAGGQMAGMVPGMDPWMGMLMGGAAGGFG